MVKASNRWRLHHRRVQASAGSKDLAPSSARLSGDLDMSSLADMQQQVTEMQRTLQPTEQQADMQQQLNEMQLTLQRIEQQVRTCSASIFPVQARGARTVSKAVWPWQMNCEMSRGFQRSRHPQRRTWSLSRNCL